MWHVFNDNTCIPSKHSGLDPVAEASTTPETFRPTCALTFTVVTRGTAQFHDVFGWYNVTGAKPDSSDLHPMLGCTDGAGKASVLDLSKEPAYKGGEIGFFLLTPESHTGDKHCAGGDCCPSLTRLAGGEGYVFYSERKYNPDLSGSTATSFIHLLTYDSHITKTKFYFAWEDIFGGSNNDFTDLVASVEGVQCSGGGVSCDTGKKGRCAHGVTECAAGVVSCASLLDPRAEACDGVDDDCNGAVDDGAKCPTPGDLCRDGRCVPPCGKGEFKCGPGTTCDDASGLCVDPKCVGKSCPDGQICRGGTCGAPCSDVACPHGQVCIDDACIDPCASTKCAAGQVCRSGVCFDGCTSCSGVSCADGTKCDGATSDCVDPSCATPCGPGTFCKSGTCVDACEGAKCPSGQTCEKGQCVGPGAIDPGSPDGGLGSSDVDGGALGDAGNGAAPGDLPATGACQCGIVGGATGPAPLAAFALVMAFARRRRRAPHRRS
jgi:MYXO-CTERM domain-containing protein